MRSSLGFVAMLLAIWLLAWGSLSWANVASGLVVALGLLVAIPGARRPGHLPVVRPVALARLAVRLARDVVVSNVLLAREVVARRPRISTGVVRVPLPECSDELLTLLANLIALTPGTMPVDVRRDPSEIVIHVLHLRSVDDVRQDVWSLRDLVVRAFGTPAAIAAVAGR
jgi:multicomponent Na+:H+ antiporter subunit E